MSGLGGVGKARRDGAPTVALLVVTKEGREVLRITEDKKYVPGEGLDLDEALAAFADVLAEQQASAKKSLVL